MVSNYPLGGHPLFRLANNVRRHMVFWSCNWVEHPKPTEAAEMLSGLDTKRIYFWTHNSTAASNFPLRSDDTFPGNLFFSMALIISCFVIIMIAKN